MALAERKDPYLSFHFAVEITGLTVAGFSEVTGLTFETEVETVREGGWNLHERQLAGPTKFPSRLILKHGLSDANVLWPWYDGVRQGRIQRRDIAILLMNGAGEEKQRWTFSRACPVKWTGPDLKAGAAEIAFEAIELVHEGLLPSLKK